MKVQDRAVRRAVAAALAEAKKSELPDPEAGALAVVRTLAPRLREQMIFLFIAQAVRELLRAESAAAGRNARRQPDPQMKRDLRRANKAYLDEVRAGVLTLLDEYAEKMHLDWTKKLLKTPFALKDGSYVVFGDADEAQHQERIEIHMDNVMGNFAHAADHVKAIAHLKITGARTINEALA